MVCCSMWSTGGVLFYVEHWWCVVLCGALVVCCSMWSTGGVLFYVYGALVVCCSMWSTGGMCRVSSRIFLFRGEDCVLRSIVCEACKVFEPIFEYQSPMHEKT